MDRKRLLLFAGTTEGRELAEYLEKAGVPADICVATEYGGELIVESTGCHRIHTGRLDREEMSALMRGRAITHVVDATHPYAVEVTENIEAACREAGCVYLRLLREETDAGEAKGGVETGGSKTTEGNGTAGTAVSEEPRLVTVASVREAVDYLQERPGNILAATGSRELSLYTQLKDWRSRVYARILSTKESMDAAASCGFQGRNLICMQGPFTEELNTAMLRSVRAAYMVTKESGRAGGFPEKLRAARAAGAALIVVGRPPQKEGFDFAGLIARLGEEEVLPASPLRDGGNPGCAITEEAGTCGEIRTGEIREAGHPDEGTAGRAPDPAGEPCRLVSLVGIGMGAPGGMTLEAEQAIREADLLIGAARMLETVPVRPGQERFASYLAAGIAGHIMAHTRRRRVCVLLSGDVGFYSGAKKLLACLEEPEAAGQIRIRILCGISSVVYLCGRLRTSWEDVKLLSLHGRQANLVAAVAAYPKVFALAGKQDTFRSLCAELTEYGLGDAVVHVGSNLSYPNEQILHAPAKEAGSLEPGDLSAVLIENPHAGQIVTHGLADEAFIRGKVPMTKSEVRSISLSRLELKRDSILYDIGAGTGSVSIEAARMALDGTVWAVEKKPEAVELIRRNMRHLRTPNVRVVEGTAPEALGELPVPTHAFLGGTSGNMEAILRLLLEKNPGIRIVINAIALETVGEALRALRMLPVTDPEVVCVNISRSREIGQYHMMMGQNPVYIISCSGTIREEQM